MTDRVKDLIDLTVAQRLKVAGKLHQPISGQEMKDLMKGVWLDVSQSHSRRVTTSVAKLQRTVTTSSIIYDFERDSVLLSTEHFKIQGHTVECYKFPEGMSARKIKSLAGEGMALPSVGSVIWALFLAKRFPEP